MKPTTKSKGKVTTVYCEPCVVKFIFRSNRPLEDFRCHHCGRPLTMKHRRGFIPVRFGEDVDMLLTPKAKAQDYEASRRAAARFAPGLLRVVRGRGADE